MDHERSPQVTTSAPQAPAVQPQTVEDTMPAPEHIQIISPRPSHSNGVTIASTARPQTSSTGPSDRPLLSAASDGYHTLSRSHENPYGDFERVPPPPPARSRDEHGRVHSNRQNLASAIGLPGLLPRQENSGIDWIVPVNEKDHTRRTVGERLKPTIDNATIERNKYATKALWTNYVLNIAIGLQVFLGALTTGVAAATTNARQAQISTSILGGLSTLVASYLARARGSGEPELSITRVKDLEQFLRECMAFQIDHAHEYSTPENGLDVRLEDLRRRFEELLGNANGERKLSGVGITSTRMAS